jgi:aromatic ring-cleaving dioxygenase
LTAKRIYSRVDVSGHRFHPLPAAASRRDGHFLAPRMTDAAQAAARDPTGIRGYHAHVYYDPAESRERAARLREALASAFPDARLGRWHDAPVGPHPASMYQVAFAADRLAAILPWLMLNRDGLTVLLHPETGDDYADHSRHAAWLGEVLPLRLEVLRRADQAAG